MAGRPTNRSFLHGDELVRASVAGKPYRILIVDDHVVVRRGLRALLEGQAGIEISGEANNGVEALEQAKRAKPDLVLLDLTMPEMNGLDAARAIREASPQTDILVLTMHFSEELAREVLRCGAMGYLLKTDAENDLLAAVDHVRHRQTFFTGTLARRIIRNYVGVPEENAAEKDVKDPLANSPLTARELEVVQLLAEGKSNKEAAYDLNVSTRTIESHRTHIMHKMKFRSFSDLVRYAIRNKLVSP